MTIALVITFSGADRAGIVDAISTCIAAHEGNWEQSRSVRLAGYFAGVILATVPSDRTDALSGDLRAIEGISIDIARGDSAASGADKLYTLELVGTDQPGIVRQISRVLVSHGANIHELETNTESAPMDGGMIFRAMARLSCPEGLEIAKLTRELEKLADDLMVELSFE
ncbi:MAG: hypothetical protein KC503_31495 [Myxococcales bacterium]|nr:hypothetical protein [Myxococcales bacterium]